ncbi:MAG: response regulator [Tannerella sp.]|jgi:ligand-binding sensor domain-containing protein/signal transduction histidine kinase/DNA-binding response OmpR family regulator|nr:response regulator [Tannerella sp.]
MMIRSILNKSLTILICLWSHQHIHCSVVDRQPLIGFTHLKVESGLPHNSVLDIIQDQKGFMWFATMDGLARYDGADFKVFHYNPEDDINNSLKSNYIVSLFEDKDQKIWVGTIDGVFIYDPRFESFQKFTTPTSEGKTVQGKIEQIVTDHEGNIWIAGYGTGAYRYCPDSGEIDLFEYSGEKGCLSSNLVMDIYIDHDGFIWIGALGISGSGINLFNPTKKTFTTYKLSDIYSNIGVSKIIGNESETLFLGSPNSGVYTMNKTTKQIIKFTDDDQNNMFVNDITFINDNEIWISTNSGIYTCNIITKKLQHITQNFADSRSLSSSSVTCFAFDRERGMWIGTFSGGVNYLPANYQIFEKFYPASDGNQLSGKDVRDICEDQSGILWIATERNGLNRFNPITGNFMHFTMENGRVRSNQITSLLDMGSELWIGYLAEGAEIMNKSTGERRRIVTNTDPIDNTILSLHQSCNGDVWIGTTLCLAKYSGRTGQITVVDEVPYGIYVLDLLEDSRQTMWVATYGKGIYHYDPHTGKWMLYKHVPNDPASLCYDYCISLSEDNDGNIWAGTEGGGVSCFDPHTGTFETYSIRKGLPSNTVNKVVDDNLGNLWFSTTKGLSCMNKTTQNIVTYTHSNGLLNDQFNYKSGLLTSNGHLYFGSTEGFIRFNSRSVVKNRYQPTVALTGFRIFNKDVPIGAHSVLDSSIVTNPEIRLSYKESTISISFAALSYNAPELNQYAYIMDNYDKEWVYTRNQRSVTYANIPPGNYTFRVKGSNNDGIWSKDEAIVKIRITPPWWDSFPAKGLYIALFTILLYSGYRWYKQKNNLKTQQTIININRAKEKTLYEAKMRFFATVSHEIKTPLSLIKAPYEQISKDGGLSENDKENMEIMGMNIDRLINLTNQLLDFSKIENENFLFRYTLTNIQETIMLVVQQFKGVLKQKNIRLSLNLPSAELKYYVDSEALTKIVSNLIQNASKHALNQINIALCQQKYCFEIKVSNDGKAIMPTDHERVFDMFYQITDDRKKEGAGLGLSIVKHLAELHKGRVYIDGACSDQTCFVVEIPLISNLPESIMSNGDETLINEDTALSESPNSTQKQMTILIVEDHMDMQHFLQKLLSTQYNVYLADEGKQALHILDRINIDLIVSDILMPKIDGLTLCQTVKTCIKYSHIPVILLTAKSDLKTKIEGMEAGADAYVEKPFSSTFLLARIHNILNNIRLQKEAFLNSPYMLINSVANNEADEKFLELINEIILDHLSDNDFSIEQLARKVNMSRSTLDRKMKGTVQLTTNDFIKLVRIKKAAQLLSEGKYKINEVCYITGFTSPSYFSKCFREHFGMSPNDLLRKKKNEDK